MLLFMSKSLTYAQRSVRFLERKGIGAVIIKAPAELSDGGCSYGIQLADKNAAAAIDILKPLGLYPQKIYRRDGDEYRRVNM